MPGWCCESMIAPFVAHGTQINLYDISFDGSLKCHTDITDDTDVFYVTNYFGYENTLPLEIVKRFKEKGSIILYDRTHSMLMEEDPYLALADYSFASIRKWMGVVAGAVVYGVKDDNLKPYPHLECKERAMRMKKSFIKGDNRIDKQTFLNFYSEFGHHLVDDYQNYEMDDLSYALYKSEDLEAMRRKRRENAKYLHEHLNLMTLAPLTDKAVPLFVPVFFDTTEQRNAVRKKLIETQIYCPIHWPKNQMITSEMQVNRVFDTELSLICDQRYDITDMQKIIEIIQ